MQKDVSTVGATISELSAMTSTAGLQLLVLEHGCLARCPLPRTGSVRIGRSESSEIVLSDAAASRLHAILHMAGTLELEDAGSHNGTRVRNERIGSGQRVRVSIGDPIQIGNAVLLVQNAPSVGRSSKPLNLQQAAHAGSEYLVVDEAMLKVYDRVQRVADSSINILILGETGVGKEVIAEAVHRASGRRSRGPFVRINCAALAESLVESELFGHQQGAFTGALRDKVGLLEAADKGTVFLDEAGELPLPVQAKLLRVIESHEVTRVGGVKSAPLDVRFVAATNRNLQDEVRRGTFREDLFFRLNGVSVTVPPLRARPAELEPLIAMFAAGISREAERPIPHFSTAALAKLRSHSWPGNIRELRNVIECAVLLAGGSDVDVSHLPPALGDNEPLVPLDRQAPQEDSAGPAGLDSRQRAERERIMQALHLCNGNQSRAAERLKMPRRTLVAKLAAYDVPRPRKPSAG
jgi:two-component system, NtrC family, response regulator AtoC